MQQMLRPQELKQFPVLGTAVDIHSDYPHWLAARLDQGLGTHVVTLNAEMTMMAEQDQHLARIIDQADLVIPDGAGIVLYLRLHHQPIQRCPGIELAETLLHLAVQPTSAWSVFFYGGAPGVAAAATQRWQQRLPGLQVVGTEHGYLKPEQMEPLLAQLQVLQPRVIFVGLGGTATGILDCPTSPSVPPLSVGGGSAVASIFGLNVRPEPPNGCATTT